MPSSSSLQSNTPTAGLREGLVDVAVLRRSVDDDRFATALIGVEPRFAAVTTGHALARRRNVTLHDFAGRTVAIDGRTGTTTEQLWPANAAPAGTRSVDGVDEWLTVIAAGQAVGITSEATARQHPQPGVTYRPSATRSRCRSGSPGGATARRRPCRTCSSWSAARTG